LPNRYRSCQPEAGPRSCQRTGVLRSHSPHFRPEGLRP